MSQTIPSSGPVSGKATVLLTRPRAASERFAAGLDVPVVISPLMEAAWLEPEPPGFVPDAVVFTSATGVEGYARLHGAQGRAFCVGDRTAEAAREAGFEALSAGGAVDDLAALLDREARDLRLLHAQGRHVTAGLGDRVTPYVVYEQLPLPLTDAARQLLGRAGAVIVPLFSPRSVVLFAAQLDGNETAAIGVVALSDAVAEAARSSGLHVARVAQRPDGAAMREVLADLLG